MEDIEYPELLSDNVKCKGCSILTQAKPFYSFMDYKEVNESVDILFLSDCFKSTYDGSIRSLTSDNEKFLSDTINEIAGDKEVKWKCLAAIKCPSIKELDMTPNNMKICRQHLADTIDKIKPKLILPMGNLAMKMLIRKSGIKDKRGQTFYYETENESSGNSYPVVPIYHPGSINYEPHNKILFIQDIKNAYNKYIIKIESSISYDFKIVQSSSELIDLAWLSSTIKTIAVDLETTGLDFKKDDILTYAISWDDNKAICVPVFHKEGKIEPNKALDFIKSVCKNKNNNKVFHNAKFDLKMLKKHNIEVYNVEDTAIMHHQIDENKPHHLIDLAKELFPERLQEF